MNEGCTDNEILSIGNLSIEYNGKRSVDEVSVSVHRGQIVGLVGESGAGKSTVLKSIVKLLPADAEVISGTIDFAGVDILSLGDDELTAIRGSRIATIFQNPGSSLDPSMRIGKQIVEVIRQHAEATKKEAKAEALTLLGRMGLPNVESLFKAYPFELSGGMQQRVAIALAMAFKPAVLLADEPTSALDSTTQLSIVRELVDLNRTFGTAILLVTHNIGLAYHMCDEIHVMNDGALIESGDAETVIKNPQSLLTKQLIDAVPQVIS